MESINDLKIFDKLIKENKTWNINNGKELLMHKIHAYPAKFPSFLIPKIIQHLNDKGAITNSIVDIFCGCGTSALESKLLSKDFHGYDINPVATLIAKTKSQTYDGDLLSHFFSKIIERTKQIHTQENIMLKNERLNYWFERDVIIDLFKLLKSIEEICPQGKYRNFFLTALSNILKPCSRWLTKSIKPQVDPYKISILPLVAFKSQFDFMIRAINEINTQMLTKSKIDIQTKNSLKIKCQQPFGDLIITSPPYVTSYEYADLHQLSTLWLGYVEDYKDLRKGTIGSVYNKKEIKERLNTTGEVICKKLEKVAPSKSKSVKSYFLDINKTVVQAKTILKHEGYAAFVIGNTSYKGVNINNAKYLTHCFMENGFDDITITKRKISSKILTPFRDEFGKFTNDKQGRKVYSHEYLVLAKKVN
jgi:DNA modification methylase